MCFTPYFVLRQGPLAPPLDKIFGLRNFSFGLVVNPITVQNFSFLGYLKMPGNFFPMLILWGLMGPWFRPWTAIFGFQIFSCSFRATVISIPIFTLLRYRKVL